MFNYLIYVSVFNCSSFKVGDEVEVVEEIDLYHSKSPFNPGDHGIIIDIKKADESRLVDLSVFLFLSSHASIH